MTASRLRRATRVILARLSVLLVSLGVSVVLSRSLGAEGRGQYYVLSSIVNVGFTIGHISLEQAHLPLWREDALHGRLAGNIVWLGIAVGGTAAALTAAGTWIGSYFGWISVPNIGLLFASCLAIPLSCLTAYANGVLVLRGQLVLLSKLQLSAALIQGVVLVTSALAGILSVTMVMLTYVLVSGIPFAIAMLGGHIVPGRLDIQLAARTVKTGLGFHSFTVAQLLLLRVDVLLLSTRVTSAEIGYYSLSVTLAWLLFLGTDVVSQMAVPAQGGRDEVLAAKETLNAVRINVTMAAAGGLALVVLGPVLIPVVFGNEFVHSIVSLRYLLLGVSFLALVRPMSNLLLRWERRRALAGASVIGLTLNVVANLLLIPRYGIEGSAIASAIGYAAMAATTGLVWFHANRKLTANLAD